MAELWVRMEELFPNLWVATNGLPNPNNSKFETWCRKLSDLTNRDFGLAFKTLEGRVADAAQAGEKTFPPSYAEFLGLSKGRPSDPVRAQQARQAFNELPALPQLMTEEDKQAGRDALSALKGAFRG